MYIVFLHTELCGNKLFHQFKQEGMRIYTSEQMAGKTFYRRHKIIQYIQCLCCYTTLALNSSGIVYFLQTRLKKERTKFSITVSFIIWVCCLTGRQVKHSLYHVVPSIRQWITVARFGQQMDQHWQLQCSSSSGWSGQRAIYIDRTVDDRIKPGSSWELLHFWNIQRQWLCNDK